MKNKKKSAYYLFVGLVIVLSIGFAAYATTLNLNGNFGVLSTKVKVEWESPHLTENSVAGDVTIDPNNKTSASFTASFTKPGDYHEFTIDAVNKGNTAVEINNISFKFYKVEVVDNEEVQTLISKPSYINYYLTDSNGNVLDEGDTISKDDTKTYKVKVEVDKNVDEVDLPKTAINMMMELDINYEYSK